MKKITKEQLNSIGLRAYPKAPYIFGDLKQALWDGFNLE